MFGDKSQDHGDSGVSIVLALSCFASKGLAAGSWSSR